ncbi:MAG TPA: Gfo/Idh/MocA family oxidoreductase [Solirubrobacteraceae bacterium]|nr:Gfo/Idh/MocA family oxidoreductase [Solirubrobacteraceae bacterium]
MPSLRAAIIGFGLAGRFFHAPLIAATEGLVLASVVTANPERQAQVSREHPDAKILTSPTELWDRADDHDLVVVATSNDAHAPLATAAIDHRLPVVVDKPLATTSAEAQALLSMAERASTLLTVFQNRRWDSDQLTLARLRAEDRLGTVLRYESRFERWRPAASAQAWRDSTPPEHGGGQLLDLGPHLVDQALVLFGPVTHVYAEIDARRGAPGDDDAFLALRHASEVISHLRASAITAAPGPRLRVLGTKAAFVIQGLDGQEDALRSGARPDQVPDWGAEPESRWGRLTSGEEGAPVPSERGDWPRFYVLLGQALRDGGPPPVDPSDAVAALRVLEAARRSAASGEVVTLASDAYPAAPHRLPAA